MTVEELAQLLRALSDPCRLRLLLLCAEQQASVSDLAAALDETEPNVSRHLKALAAAGLLRRTRRGQRVEYRLAPTLPCEELIAATLRAGAIDDARLARARSRLVAAESTESASRAPAREASVRGRAEGDHERRLGAAIAVALADAADATADRAAGKTPGRIVLTAGRFPVAALRRLCAGSAANLLLVSTDTVAERTAQRRRLAEAGIAGEVQLRGDLSRALAALPADRHVVQSCLDLRAVRGWAEVESRLRWLQRVPLTRCADWLLFDYDTLEVALGSGVRNLPAELRARLASLGFDTRRIEPIEADGHHRLLVHCMPRSADAARAA